MIRRAAAMPQDQEKKPLVVGLGEVLWDVFPDGKRLGGAPANFAYHASRQGCEGVVVSAVGKDAFGREIEALFADRKVSAFLSEVVAPTGTVEISLDSSGVPAYVFSENCAWDNLPFTAETESLARRASAVCFGSLAQRSPRSRETIRRFLDCVPASALRVFDMNLRQNFFTEEVLLDSFARCTVLKINEDEFPLAAALVGAPGASREAFFPAFFGKFPSARLVILTLGKAGSLVVSREGARSRVSADPSVKIADTVGAGDAFTAGFVSALLFGAPLEAAHRHAAALADFVCSRAGAMPEIPAELAFPARLG